MFAFIIAKFKDSYFNEQIIANQCSYQGYWADLKIRTNLNLFVVEPTLTRLTWDLDFIHKIANCFKCQGEIYNGVMFLQKFHD